MNWTAFALGLVACVASFFVGALWEQSASSERIRGEQNRIMQQVVALEDRTRENEARLDRLEAEADGGLGLPAETMTRGAAAP